MLVVKNILSELLFPKLSNIVEENCESFFRGSFGLRFYERGEHLFEHFRCLVVTD